MKRIMSKVFGAFIAGSMVLSAMPTVVSAAEADIQPIDYETEYEDGTLIDFGEGARVCGYGEEENLQLVSGVLRIVSGEFTEIEDESDEEDEEGGFYLDGVLEVKFYNAEDVNVVNIYIHYLNADVMEDDIVFSTWVEGFRNVGDGDYIFDVSEYKYDVEIGEEDITDDDDTDEDTDDDTIVDDTTADDTTDVVDPVKAVIDMITALPDPDKVTLDDNYAIYEAYDAYYNLDEDQKKEVDPDLVEKLDADMIAITRAFIDFYTELANELLADYGDIISDDAKTGLESNLEYSKKVYDDESSSLFTLEEALDNLYYACKTADKELDDIYEFVEGAEASWKKGGKDPYKVRASQKGLSDDAYDSFIAAGSVVIVDETQLTGDQFTASEGSVIIEIIPEFLETLSVGEHTLTIKFENNVSMTTKFTIEAAADVPASGESVSPAVYVGVAMVLLAGAAFVLRKRILSEEK